MKSRKHRVHRGFIKRYTLSFTIDIYIFTIDGILSINGINGKSMVKIPTPRRESKMARGFKEIKRNKETIVQRDMKQTDYEHLERLYKTDSSRVANARVWFKRPAYHCREAYEAWKKRRNGITE